MLHFCTLFVLAKHSPFKVPIPLTISCRRDGEWLKAGTAGCADRHSLGHVRLLRRFVGADARRAFFATTIVDLVQLVS
jgi:hypothetical protein